MRIVDRQKVIEAIDRMHERADVEGWPEAEALAEAFGWTHPTEMPDGQWLRVCLDAALR